MRGIPFLYLTDNRPDFSGRLFLKRGTLAIAERLGRFSAPKRCRNGIMDLLHFKISEYGISIAFRTVKAPDFSCLCPSFLGESSGLRKND